MKSSKSISKSSSARRAIRTLSWVAAGAVAAFSAAESSAAVANVLYNPIVTQVGNGTNAVSSAGNTTTIVMFDAIVPNQIISTAAYNSSATGTRLVNAGSSTSEGLLANSPTISNNAAKGLPTAGTTYAWSGGYDAADNTAGVFAAAANANRVVGEVTVGAASLSNPTVVQSQTQATAYAGSNIRSAVGDDAAANYWAGGTAASVTATAGWRYFNNNTQLTTTNSTNVRSTEILGVNLFGSTGAGTTPGRGIYAIGGTSGGTPTTTGQTASLLLGTGSASSPYEFVMIDDPGNAASTTATFGYDTIYVADDSATGSNGGIQKWVWNGTAWSNPYTLNDGIGGNRGLAGQLDTVTNSVYLWATNAAGTKLEEVTDLLSATTGAGESVVTLDTAPANTVFRGVALSPVPEPASAGLLLGAAGIFLGRRARRK